jgi:hypothetical protein
MCSIAAAHRLAHGAKSELERHLAKDLQGDLPERRDYELDEEFDKSLHERVSCQ